MELAIWAIRYFIFSVGPQVSETTFLKHVDIIFNQIYIDVFFQSGPNSVVKNPMLIACFFWEGKKCAEKEGKKVCLERKEGRRIKVEWPF